jgi:hypothetical protein
MEWFRLVISAIVWVMTLSMAIAGVFLAYLHLNLPPNQEANSTLKIGETLEFSSDVVGLTVMALALVFFYLAGKWFLFGTGPTGQDLHDFLVKTPGEHIPRSELLKYITKRR